MLQFQGKNAEGVGNICLSGAGPEGKERVRQGITTIRYLRERLGNRKSCTVLLPRDYPFCDMCLKNYVH